MVRIIIFSLVMLKTAIVFAGGYTWSDTEKSIINSLWIKNLPEKPANISSKFAFNEQAAEFGHQLFFDKRLSANGEMACSLCHQPDKYFTDGLQTSRGIGEVRRNAPTIVGVAYSNWFFLDGRADSLWMQAMGPTEHPDEQGGDRTMFAHIIYNDKAYRKRYETLFGNLPVLNDKKRFPEHAAPIRGTAENKAWLKMKKEDREAINQVFVNVGKAIEAYEQKLKPGISKFDQYAESIAKGDTKQAAEIYSSDEAKGLKLFIGKANCVLCHNGPLFSDYGFHNIATPPVDVERYDWGRYKGVSRLLKSKFNCRSKYNDFKERGCDELEYIIRKKEHTAGAFRTPSLRNVTKTSPYMHAGQYKTISDVLNHYSDTPSTKVGKSDLVAFKFDLSKKELAQLEKFLKTLESEIDAEKRWLSAPK